ncbi:MAG TPA: L-seryl-tRNA(Sec) selenium transferase, partial [Planctomycetota bacterium]|nr:L-seryl-tRNA(Sec) selenium transferase [Planctomycetota bacterium]
GPMAAADRIQEALRKIPSVDQILLDPTLALPVRMWGREQVVRHARAVLESLREEIRGSRNVPVEALDRSAIVKSLLERLKSDERPGLRRVINATGIVLHTGLGRAVLAPEALEAVQRELAGYAALEVDRSTGERSIREIHVAKLICEVAEAEAATVVNNNAGATMLALAALAGGKEVIVSRGHLIEIGGSFRMPDVMAQSGCRLVEVGTTNKTYLRDFESAIGADAGLLMHVHTSNYRIIGFATEVTIEELVALGRKRNLPVMDDIGSGAMVDLKPWGIHDEPTVQGSLRAGADVVTFSGDKLLGGPQAGILVGSRKAIDAVRKHPLFRALRPGKFSLVALEATLRLYRNPDTVMERVPTLRMLTVVADSLESKALELAKRLKRLPGFSVEVLDDVSEAGGGSMPAVRLPTKVVAVRSDRAGLQALAQTLRDGDPCIMTRVQRERVLFDVRTLLEGEVEQVESAMARIASR